MTPGRGPGDPALTGRLTSQPSSHRALTTSRKPLCTATCSAVLLVSFGALGWHPAARSRRAASGWFLREEAEGCCAHWQNCGPRPPQPPGLTPGLRSAEPCCPGHRAGPRPPGPAAADAAAPPGPGRQPPAGPSCPGSCCPPAGALLVSSWPLLPTLGWAKPGTRVGPGACLLGVSPQQVQRPGHAAQGRLHHQPPGVLQVALLGSKLVQDDAQGACRGGRGGRGRGEGAGRG